MLFYELIRYFRNENQEKLTVDASSEIEISVVLYEFICANFSRARSDIFQTSDHLIESGVVDSLGLLSIVDFIETTFGLTVSDADVVADNFGSIDAIAAYILRSDGKSDGAFV